MKLVSKPSDARYIEIFNRQRIQKGLDLSRLLKYSKTFTVRLLMNAKCFRC